MITGTVRNPDGVSADAVVVGNNRHPGRRTPQNLPAQPQAAVGPRVGLPAVDNPGLDLQLLGGEDLDSHAREEPRRVRRNVGRLVCPVIELIETKQTHVGQEDPGIDVNAMQRVKVIAAVGLVQVAIGIVQLPLSAGKARIVARRRRGIQT